jgi:hydrogenase maturation protein HypF
MSAEPSIRRRVLTITGQVQGVGFRPFVYRLALEHGLSGCVRNTPEGVRIEIQGHAGPLEEFAQSLEREAPPMAAIVAVHSADLIPVPDEKCFTILHSSAGSGHNVLISPDTATCADCRREILDPADRRYHYPFTNCTNCGPRYTITRAIPYDRGTTSMACFPMCPLCAAEYANPLDRRFHAQPNACPVCGPKVWCVSPQDPFTAPDQATLQGVAALDAVARALVRGRIAAIKGLGGFHLACLAGGAGGQTAVDELRKRKQRPHKPLAVMVPDLETARAIAQVDEQATSLLTGAQRPIVLCPLRPKSTLSPNVAPDTDQIGVMLPYTPLHIVLLRVVADLLEPGLLPALVMTSGNMSAAPICLGNREALQRLGNIADIFLLHNRDILIRTDDSVVRPLPASGDAPPEVQFFRRARGYTPSPVFLPPLPGGAAPSVLGLGPELKNTLCLTKGDQAFVSQHIGDLENIETLGFFHEIAEHLQAILQTRAQALIRDLHPDYLSSRHAMQQTELPVFALQHHFAHIHAVLAEHRHQGPALGLALDGTGLGDDGTLWGGECLFVDTDILEHHRLGRFSQILLPGGETAIREPWRIAQACLHALGINDPVSSPWPWLPEQERASALLPLLLEKRLNSPTSSSCGRLFDAVSAMIGLKTVISYEGQAAIALEAVQDMAESCAYGCSLGEGDGLCVLDTLELFAQAHADWNAGTPTGVVSRRFHLGLIQGLADWAAECSRQTGVTVVALSGGAMQNRTLRLELPAALIRRGLVPLCHAYLPPNDGCISLGQAAWGRLLVSRVG